LQCYAIAILVNTASSASIELCHKQNIQVEFIRYLFVLFYHNEVITQVSFWFMPNCGPLKKATWPTTGTWPTGWELLTYISYPSIQ